MKEFESAPLVRVRLDGPVRIVFKEGQFAGFSRDDRSSGTLRTWTLPFETMTEYFDAMLATRALGKGYWTKLFTSALEPDDELYVAARELFDDLDAAQLIERFGAATLDSDDA